MIAKKFLDYLNRVERWHVLVLPVALTVIIAVIMVHGVPCIEQSCDGLRPFTLRVTLGLSPALVIMLVLELMADDFMRSLNGLKSAGQSGSSLRRLLFRPFSVRPFLVVKEGKPASGATDPLVQVGGPAQLIVYDDSAAVLEKGGKLTRVVKKGFADLETFERVWDTVDLHPVHWVYDVSAMSKDGIPVTCQADVTLKLDDGGQKPTEDEPYPVTEQAVFWATTRKWVRDANQSEDDQEFDWARRAVIGMTAGTLRAILARYLLDQLLGPSESNNSHYRTEIQAALEKELQSEFPNVGAKLVKVELGDIKLDDKVILANNVEDKVIQQQVEAWKATWKRWDMERQAEGDAKRLEHVEAAKAQAQAEMIFAITKAFEKLAQAGATIPSQLVLLRIFEVLKRSSYDPQSGMLFLPAEMLRTWQLVKEMTKP